ncbi:hypothetical protein, partial [Lactobacillus acetotolerans]|uniref:hypothetical protein n=1 Tax=Lactobacillus acetotolerans TaxID=1600 RepID=UPI0024818C02
TGAVKTVDNIQPDSSGNVDLRPEFNSLLGRNNLLTDDEMDISKATKNDPAQQAISNAKYANGVNTFHYCGVSGWETFYWKIAVQPNTNYEFTIIANSTNQLTALAATEPYIPIIVDSSGGAFGDGGNTSNGDLGNGQLNLPWQGTETGKVIFNSKNYSNIYIGCSLGSTNDGINTDITLQTTLLKADPIQSQIDNLQNQTSTKANSSDVSALQNTVNNIDSTRTPLVNGSAGDDLFAFKTNQIRLYSGNGSTCKNLPPAANTQWFTVQYIFETPNNDGIAIFRSPSNEVWTIGNNGGVYATGGWTRVANSTDVTNLQSMITGLSTKVDSLQQNSHNIVPITQA